MRKTYLLASLVYLFISTCALGVGGNMGGTDPNGSPEHPYLIEDLADFDTFADPANAATYWTTGVHTKLMTGIDLAGRTYTTAVIAPDTDNTNGPIFDGIPFAALFDGNGHIINNLTINTAGADNDFLGLFGMIEDSGMEIKNVGVVDCNLVGGDNSNYLGGLCGRNGNYSGNHGGTINNCYSTGVIIGGYNSFRLGGLCGYNVHGNISNCYSSGIVTGGYNSNSLGGLCGDIYKGIISNCYSSGIITAGSFSRSLGGLCGQNNQGTIRNCFWDKESSGQTTSAGGWAMSTAQMKQEATYIGWNSGAWTINDGNDYPHLLWEGKPEPVITTDYLARTYAGDGISQPFEIVAAADLYCMSRRVNDWDKKFILKADIDMSAISDYWPLTDFTGSFDGDGYTIRNLTIDVTAIGNRSQLGLFGKINTGGDVKNVGLTGTNIIGGDYSEFFGVLCGVNFGTVSNCYATGTVCGNNSYSLGGLCGVNSYGNISNCYAIVLVIGGDNSFCFGGLCGLNDYGNISNCYATGAINSGDSSGFLGGLCGYNAQGTISDCYATGTVTGRVSSDGFGGLCGYNDRGIISNCHATGSVTGGDHSGTLGGLCGSNYGWGDFSDTIINCYATGTITGGDVSYSLGGLCGNNEYGNISNCYSVGKVKGGNGSESLGGFCASHSRHGAEIINCFWDVETSEIGNSGDDNYGATGKTTAQMQTEGTFTGWDFSDGDGDPAVWMMLREGEDYPRLAWQEVFAGDIAGLYGADMVDFAYLANYWGLTGCKSGTDCGRADIDTSGDVGLTDLAAVANDWLK